MQTPTRRYLLQADAALGPLPAWLAPAAGKALRQSIVESAAFVRVPANNGTVRQAIAK